jgi:hypothetical protein
VLHDYNLSLSPRVPETKLVSVIKQKIKEHLPQGVRYRNVGPLNAVLNESVRIDLYLGNHETYVAINLGFYILFTTLSMVLLFSLFSSSIEIPLAKIIVLLLSSVFPSVKIAA